MKLTDLLAVAGIIGDTPGVCYLCGDPTDLGTPGPPSSGFTSWSQCYAGEVLCPVCFGAMRTTDLRRRSWLVTADGMRTVTKDDRGWILDVLCDPPDSPWAAYLASAGQKQGWVSLMHRVNLSRDRYWVGVEWLDRPVNMDRRWVTDLEPTLTRLRERKIPKQSLRDGAYSPNNWAKAVAEGWEGDLRTATQLARDPRWEVIVNAGP